MDIKMVTIFGAQANGWTETIYFQASDQTAAVPLGLLYCDPRARLLSQGAFIEGYRIIDDTSPNSGNFYPVPPEYTITRRFNSPRDAVQLTALARISANNQSRRMMQLSGIPDELFFFDTEKGIFRFDDVVIGRFSTFLNALKALPFQLKVISKVPSDVNMKLISAATSAGAGSFQITSPAHGYAALDKVRINKVNTVARPYISGKWVIQAVSTDTFTVSSPSADVAFAAGPGGVIRRQRLTYSNITDGVLLRPANKKRGRAFFVPRGRRPGP